MKKRDAVKGRKQEQTPVTMSVAMQQLMLPLVLAMDATKKGLLSCRRAADRVVTPPHGAPYARRHDIRKQGTAADSGAVATTGGGVAA